MPAGGGAASISQRMVMESLLRREHVVAKLDDVMEPATWRSRERSL